MIYLLILLITFGSSYALYITGIQIAPKINSEKMLYLIAENNPPMHHGGLATKCYHLPLDWPVSFSPSPEVSSPCILHVVGETAWIQLRVLYSVNNIRYTNMQRFERKMKTKTLNHVSRDFASSPSRKFRAPYTIYVGVTYITISVLHDGYILKMKN